MFCPNCGEQMRDDARFCPQCGAEVPTWAAEGAQLAAQDNAGDSTVSEPEPEPEPVIETEAGPEPETEPQTEMPFETPSTSKVEGVQAPASAEVLDDAGRTRVMADVTPEEPQVEDTVQATVAAPVYEAPRVQDELPDTAPASEERPRKRGGALRVFKIAGVVILVACLVGAVGGGVWYVMDQQNREMQAQIDGLQDQLDAQNEKEEKEKKAEEDAKESDKKADNKREESDDASKTDSSQGSDDDEGSSTGRTAAAGTSSTDEGENDTDTGVQSFVGTWTGKLTDTYTGSWHCYAAETHPLKLTIKSINATTGQMKLDIEVLYHNHASLLESDVDSCEGDTVLTFTDVTSTFDAQNGFTVSLDIEGGQDLDSIEIRATPETYSYGQRLNVRVDSANNTSDANAVYNMETTTDTFELAKA